MLAFHRGWRASALDPRRMAASLGLPSPDRLIKSHRDGATFALFPGIWGPPVGKTGHARIPAVLPSGDQVLFTGWFDNRAEIAAQLGVPNSDSATVYGHAVERWGDETECHVIGAYAAIIDRPRLNEVRLARSPLTAPPMHYHRSDSDIAAASVPRALLALGLQAELDEERLAMHLHAAVVDRPGGWYKGIEALQLGMVVTARPNGERRIRPYDPANRPTLRLSCDQEYVEAAQALLDEAIDKALVDVRQPGVLLTGGLDSTLVSSHLLDRLPASQKLPAFTWTTEGASAAADDEFHFTDERPRVQAFAAMHPRIESHFIDSSGHAFDDGLQDLFLLAGISVTSIGLFYPYHGAFAAARSRGCDMVMGAGFGNATLSAEGRRGYTEFLKQGKLRQMWRALAARPGDHRPVWRRFLTLSLLRSLPLPVWRGISRWQGMAAPNHHRAGGALNPDWPGRTELERIAHRSDPSLERPFYRNREEEIAATVNQMDADGFDLMQAFQQKHLIGYRDVTRYRPLVEFCWSLPTDQLMRDGESRFLARRMGKGRLPEAIRTETRYGLQHGDWHVRIGRKRAVLLEELRRHLHDPEVCRLVDVQRLIGLLEQFPEASSDDPAIAYQYQIALPNGIAMARLIRYVSGTNA